MKNDLPIQDDRSAKIEYLRRKYQWIEDEHHATGEKFEKFLQEKYEKEGHKIKLENTLPIELTDKALPCNEYKKRRCLNYTFI